MQTFGLIGYPLGHSFSKKYFTQKFENEGIANAKYELFPIDSINLLPSLIKDQPNLKGLNVTIPYKIEVFPYLTEWFVPKGLNACNCIKITNNKLIGYNTDVIGFEKSFTKKWNPTVQKKALILGNGGATLAVIHVFEKLGIAYKIVSRALHAGSHLTYNDLTDYDVAESHIIVNCSPVGTYPNVLQCPAIQYNAIGGHHYLFDLVYNPEETVFLQKGRANGATIQNGYEMLVLQAEEAWKIWNEV